MNGRYVFVEVQAPVGYERSYCDTKQGSEIGAFEISNEQKVVHVEHTDPRKAASLSILKENEYGDPLGGGIFELYYQPEVKTSITYYYRSSFRRTDLYLFLYQQYGHTAHSNGQQLDSAPYRQ